MFWSLLSKLLYRAKVKPFLKTLRDPAAAQEQRLHELLRYAAATVYGKRHGFGDISCYEEFVERVPVNQYQDFRPYIQRELEGTSNVLYPEPIEVVMATSGTTGEPKLIPYTRSCKEFYTRFSLRYYVTAAHIRPIFHGKLLTMVAPAVYKRVGRWEVGYVSGHTMKTCNRLIRRKIVPSLDVLDITDWEVKFRETIRQAVETTNITACVGITSFVLALLRRTKYEVHDWLNGCQLSEKAQQRLQRALADDGTLDLRTLWPNLAVIFHSGVLRDLYEPAIRDLIGDVHIHEGYAGTEACYGFQLYEDMRGVVPVVDDVVFEFAEAMDGPLPPDVEAIPLSDVKVNTPYRIIVSSPSGLWRYDIHDVVIFTSLDPPTMRCMGKSENVINLSGEKVSELDISTALTAACEEQDALLREFVVAPQVSAHGATYHIFVEFTRPPADLNKFTVTFDSTLQNLNSLYREVRNAGTISPAVIHVVQPGSFDSYERQRLRAERFIIGQTKMPRVTSFDHIAEFLPENMPLRTI